MRHLAWQLRGQSRDGGETGESGRWQTEPLCRTDAFDACIYHPATFPLLSRLMGPETMRLVHMSAMSRDPVRAPAPAGMPDSIHWQMWQDLSLPPFLPSSLPLSLWGWGCACLPLSDSVSDSVSLFLQAP